MKKQLLLLAFLVANTTQIIVAQCIRFKDDVFSANTLTTTLYGQNTNVRGLPQPLLMDIYEPAADTMQKRPLLLLAFGGSFTYGDRKSPDIVQLCNAFVKKGYVCASIDYRLGIEGTETQTITPKTAAEAVVRGTHDGMAAVRFLKANAATYKIDTANIVFGGVSAGGFIALHNSFLNSVEEFEKYVDIKLDWAKIGGINGNSGTPGVSSKVKAVINLCGALGHRAWIADNPDVKVYSMHGDADGTVPYSHDTIVVFSKPIIVVDGSHSIDTFAKSNPNLGIQHQLYTWYGADHVPFVLGEKSIEYMDTTIRFVNNYLYTNVIDTIVLCPGLVGVNDLPKLSAKVFPNPSYGQINIAIEEAMQGKVNCKIFNAMGQMVYAQSFSGNLQIPTSQWARGLYQIQLIGDNKILTTKQMIE